MQTDSGSPSNYHLEHTTATVDLGVSGGRLLCRTQGRGLIDKPKTIDIPLSALRNFCLVQTVGAQNLRGRTFEGDYSYDSEFIFSYVDGERTASKRVFVSSSDPSFQAFLEDLKRERPDASLLHLDPAEAQKQIGVASARTTVFVIVGLLVGVPVAIAVIFLLFKILR